MRNRLLYSLLFLTLGSNSVMEMVVAQGRNTTVGVNVGVVLDMDNWVGQMGLSCIVTALSDFYAAHSTYLTRLLLHVKDSNKDVVGAAASVLDLIKNGEVQAIIGPSTSMQAEFAIQLGGKAQVPIISFSASSPFLTSGATPYFFRATQNDSTQVKAIAAIVEKFRWREVVPVYVNNEYGQGIIPYLLGALQAIDARVPYQSPISPVATDDQIVQELYKLMTMQTRVFIVHISPTLGSRLFTKVREVGMMSEGYVWIVTDGMTNFLNSLTPPVLDSMQGVLGVRPYLPTSKELETSLARWKKKMFRQGSIDAALNIYGLWAYDAATVLAMAIEKAGTVNIGFGKGNVSSDSNDLATLRVSRNGPGLIQALSNARFKGLTGDFFFVNGQLPPSVFEIVNVLGHGPRGIGFWTPTNGLVRKLYSTSESSLAAVIWPGDSTSVPKGWEIPTSGKKLRIGVPVKDDYNGFVKVTRDPITNTTKVTGYCIDVFDAVVKMLPYALTYEYTPFANSDGRSAGTYNDLVYQVYLGNFDAVVGDVAIIYNRSLYVDFTLPFTESRHAMIVPVKDDKYKNAWVFLKPLTWDLWLACFCFFVFIGFVVWAFEHRINDDFGGPTSYQAGTSFFFSFSTMVFAQRERVVSNFTRIVLIIWWFVVLVLTQSYTASLASLLTVEQLRPTVTDVNQLIRNGETVGYQKGSFIVANLKSLGFHESKLKAYSSLEECHQLFLKGSANGGISAAFDEVTALKLFLAKHCSEYAIIEPTFKTDGMGFVFPRGSPLVDDLSRAILNVTEGEKMKEIEMAWIGTPSSCPDPKTSVSFNSLSLQSFWGLFLIAGVTSILALLIFAAMLMHQHGQVWMPSYLEPWAWSCVLYLFRTYYPRTWRFHNLR